MAVMCEHLLYDQRIGNCADKSLLVDIPIPRLAVYWYRKIGKKMDFVKIF